MEVASVGDGTSLGFQEGEAELLGLLFLSFVAGDCVVELIFEVFERMKVSVEDAAAMLEAFKFGRTVLATCFSSDGPRPEGDFISEGLDVWREGDCTHHKFSAFLVGMTDTLEAKGKKVIVVSDLCRGEVVILLDTGPFKCKKFLH